MGPVNLFILNPKLLNGELAIVKLYESYCSQPANWSSITLCSFRSNQVRAIILILDGISEHVAHIWRIIGLFGKKSICDCSRYKRMPYTDHIKKIAPNVWNYFQNDQSSTRSIQGKIVNWLQPDRFKSLLLYTTHNTFVNILPGKHD